MNAKKSPHFDIDTLRALAGDKAFGRGEAYYRHGQVEILAFEPDRVLAQVAGTVDYRTILMGSGTRIDGEPSCPAFEAMPTLDIYKRLRELGGPPALERAALFLEERMSTAQSTSWHSPVDLLVRVLME
tara:strand:- start:65 stop:451 length:387 start_codon:yes stop_codon:yes gene_type:complete